MFVGELRLDGRLNIVEVDSTHHLAEMWAWATGNLPKDRTLLLSVEGRHTDIEKDFEIHRRIAFEMQALGFLFGDETIMPIVVKNIESAPKLAVLVILLPMLEVPCEALVPERLSPHLPAIELELELS